MGSKVKVADIFSYSDVVSLSSVFRHVVICLVLKDPLHAIVALITIIMSCTVPGRWEVIVRREIHGCLCFISQLYLVLQNCVF